MKCKQKAASGHNERTGPRSGLPGPRPRPKGVVIVMGPTASGKSDMAVDLAEAFDGVVINADSMQIYRELALITARPSPEETERAPHRLYGIRSVVDGCSAAEWAELAAREVDAALAAGKLPIVVGGTGLYIRALTHGLAPVPDIPDALRAEARALLARDGAQALHRRLRDLDPAMAARLNPGDSQRLVRAYEVFRATGSSLAEWQRRHPAEPPLRHPYTTVGLIPEREALYARCNARFDRMIEAGALDEVRALAAMRLAPDTPALRAVGVPDLMAAVNGERTVEEAVAAAKQATRRYAKRQLTWLRRQVELDMTIFAQYSERSREKIFTHVYEFLLTLGI